MASPASEEEAEATSADAMTKRGPGQRVERVRLLMLMTECSPQFHPFSVSNKEDWLRGGREERRGTEQSQKETYRGGGGPLPGQRKAPFSPFFLSQPSSHWEPSWLDIIFSSCRLMIVEKGQKLSACWNFPTRQLSTLNFLYLLLGKTKKTASFYRLLEPVSHRRQVIQLQ